MTKTMLAVVKEKPEAGVALKKIPIPQPKDDEVLIKVLYASICGTDIGIYDWTPWAAGHIKPPIVIGHEIVGEIISIGSPGHSGEKQQSEDSRISKDPELRQTWQASKAELDSARMTKSNLKVGDIVSSETHIFCGKCYQCSIGNRHVCENMQLFGIGRSGGFAQYATIPIRTTWRGDKRIPLKAMSVQEPLGNAVHVVEKAQVKGKKVLVVGLGPTGLCAGLAAKAAGAKEIVGLNRSEYRRRLAEKVGFDRVIDSLPESEYNSFDAVLEMSGSAPGVETAFDGVRIAGRIIAFGIPKQKIEIDWGKYLINKELTIESVFGRRIWETWEQTSSLLTSGKIDLSTIITHEFDLKDFKKAMTVMKSGKCGKIVLRISA